MQSYHFIGICGVAMAQIAAWMKMNGARVTGSDEGVYPPMGDFLRTQGIEILTPYRAENINTAAQVVIGNALSRGNPEVEAVLEKRLPLVSLPQFLHDQILKDKLPIVVAGTHGKTTTSAALAFLLEQAGFDPGFMIGGLPIGWESGFGVGTEQWFVLEGDEYDSAFFDKRPKFLHYQPQVVLLNNIEFDHADIYTDIKDIFLQFERLIQLLPRNGCLIANAEEANLEALRIKALCEVRTFGLNHEAQIWSKLIEISPAGMSFRLNLKSGEQLACSSPLWGSHQLLNLTGAAATAEAVGVTPEGIRAGLAQFRGVRRRMELKFTDGNRWLYEDFAHHPTAIRAALTSLRARHPQAPIIAAFEPRSNTMVKNYFQKELSDALALADSVILGGLHRQDKIPRAERLNLETLCGDLRDRGLAAETFTSAQDILTYLVPSIPREAVVVIMSNGAFYGICAALAQKLQQFTV